MKLNKLQRHTAYLIMLVEYESDPKRFWDAGLCYLTYCLDDEGYEVLNGRNIFIDSDLPELFDKRTTRKGFWFPIGKEGWQKRIELLKQCVIETY